GTGGEGRLVRERRRGLGLPPMVSVPNRLVHALQGAIRRAGTPPRVPAIQPQLGQIVDPTSLTIPGSPDMVDRIRAAWGSTDYLKRLDETIVMPQLPPCTNITGIPPKARG